MKKVTLFSAFIFCTVLISYGQWSTTYLSQGTVRMGGAVLGNKAYFAGGLVWSDPDWIDTDKVEIFDMETGQWQMNYLSQARQIVTGVTCGDLLFFAGGMSNWVSSSRVDIFYDQGFWGNAELSVPRFALSAVSKDNYVLFAGGYDITLNEAFDVVDIYNISTNQWSIAHLSIPRGSMGYAVVGDLAFFAGGCNADNSVVYNRVDIYNFTTGTWDTATLSQARSFIGATTAQNKVIFAGGSVANGIPSDRVDIYNYETGTWTTDTLSQARGFYSQSATTCGKAYFVGSGIFDGGWTYGTNTIDVYDPVTSSWSVMTLPNIVTENAVVSIDSTLMSAGGFSENNPPYGIGLNTVEMFRDSVCEYGVVGIISQETTVVDFRVYPNPTSGKIYMEMPNDNHQKPLKTTIYNLQGQVVFTQMQDPQNLEINVKLSNGIYLLTVISNNTTHTKLITIQN